MRLLVLVRMNVLLLLCRWMEDGIRGMVYVHVGHLGRRRKGGTEMGMGPGLTKVDQRRPNEWNGWGDENLSELPSESRLKVEGVHSEVCKPGANREGTGGGKAERRWGGDRKWGTRKETDSQEAKPQATADYGAKFTRLVGMSWFYRSILQGGSDRRLQECRVRVHNN
jgi:hypothetical protein